MTFSSRTVKRTALGAAVTVVVGGAALGIASVADAAPTPSASPSSSAPTSAPSADPSKGTGTPPKGGPGRHGPGDHGPGRDGGALAKELATKLGLDQTKVADALKAVRDATKPTGKPTPGAARPDPAAHDAALAKALAPKLGVSESKIKTALDEIRAAHEADRTKALDDKLAAAVKAGTLSQTEADAVKKAVDKGVINVGPR